MANEAASVAAEEAPPPAPEPAMPDPPQLPKPNSAQKAMKEPAKPQTPVASMDAAKGERSQDRFRGEMCGSLCTTECVTISERDLNVSKNNYNIVLSVHVLYDALTG